MEKEFVTYDLALRLKHIGFDQPCLAVYCESKGDKLILDPKLVDWSTIFRAPLWLQAFDYLLIRTDSAITFPLSYEQKIEHLEQLIKMVEDGK